MRSRFIYAAAGAIAAVAIMWGLGLFWFASNLPDDVNDVTTHTDAVVVLTGGSERIETGLRLYADGLSDKILISGVGERGRVSDVIARGNPLSPDLVDNVTIGSTAIDTPGNAAETAAWVRAEDVRSIRLVTASYHMRRALLEFRFALPDVYIVPHSVFPPNVKSDWWRWPGTASLIAREYTKFVVALARQGMTDPPPPYLPVTASNEISELPRTDSIP